MAEQNFLSRKVSRKVRGILDQFPNIGKEIEAFVEESNVGAEAWRRTGVLTFDGNTRVKSKVTYERIRQHLIRIYNRNFSFGTVVQLCVARNKRRNSARRYKGVAKVTSRRARKGFMIKYNPDAHWSSAFYRNLSLVQYTDGHSIINISTVMMLLDFVWIRWLLTDFIARQWFWDLRVQLHTQTMSTSIKQFSKQHHTTSVRLKQHQRSVQGLSRLLGCFPRTHHSTWLTLKCWSANLKLRQHL